MLSTDKQTNKQTNRQTNATKNITSFAKEVITELIFYKSTLSENCYLWYHNIFDKYENIGHI